jgi:hypothetical protein
VPGRDSSDDLKKELGALRRLLNKVLPNGTAKKISLAVLSVAIAAVGYFGGNLQGDVSELNTEVPALQGDVSELQTDVGDTQEDVSAIRDDVEEIHSLTGDISENRDEIQRSVQRGIKRGIQQGITTTLEVLCKSGIEEVC